MDATRTANGITRLGGGNRRTGRVGRKAPASRKPAERPRTPGGPRRYGSSGGAPTPIERRVARLLGGQRIGQLAVDLSVRGGGSP